MFSCYLNQQAKLSRKLGENSYAEPEYAPVIQIPCRRELASRYVQRSDGSMVLSGTTYTTQVPVAEGDLLDGNHVESIDAPPTLGGAVPLYWSYVL